MENIAKHNINHHRLLSSESLQDKTFVTTRETRPDFHDTQEAFKSRSTAEVFRAHLIFRMCSKEWLVKHQLKVRNHGNLQLWLRYH